MYSRWQKWKIKIREKREKREKYEMSQFVLGIEINAGNFSKVYIAKYKEYKDVAIKVVEKNDINTQIGVNREIEIHSKLNHKNIVKYLGSYQDNCNFYIVLEYIKGPDLFEHLQSFPNAQLPNNLAKKYTKDIITAVIHCHKVGIIHRDIKPENILITDDDTVKLIDFGLASKGNSNDHSGTIYYGSPEIYKGLLQTKAVDIWAIGIVIFEMLAGYVPFNGFINDITINAICRNLIIYPTYLPPSAIDLIRKILVSNPFERINLEKALKHNWFNDEF
jgi:serine/threonine protein kinase